MTVTPSLEGQRIADELSDLLEAVDRALADNTSHAALRQRATEVTEQMRAAIEALCLEHAQERR